MIEFPGESFFHKLDPRTKFLWFGVIIILASLFLNMIALLIILITIFMIIAIARIPWKVVLKRVRALLLVAVLYFIFNIYSYGGRGGDVLFYIFPGFWVIPPWPITIYGLIYSLGCAFRFLIMVMAIFLLIGTTPIQRLILGLIKCKLPPEIGIAIGIGFGYIPVLIDQTRTIIEAQKARAHETEYRNPIKRLNAYKALFIPTIKNSISRGTFIAAAIEARGFSYDIRNRTYYRELKYTLEDKFIIILLIILVIIAFYLYFTLPNVVTNPLAGLDVFLK
ncbi:MAG: energy-coupling factor transporter transmembrane component T [Candidatus Methanomethylicaceae archaeon]